MRNDYSDKVVPLHTWPPEHMRRTLPSREALDNYVPSWEHSVVNLRERQFQRQLKAYRRRSHRTDGPEAA